MKLGYFLSCEEFGPEELVAQARLAEAAGFSRLWISDHYHPWVDAQDNSPFVWGVIGALSQATSLPVTTAVTCPTLRIHPAVIAQAAATAAVQLRGSFILGVGSGEALNEHILGDAWPDADTRLEMLEEAVAVIRRLWSGEQISHRGTHYRRERPHLHPPGRTATDLRLRLRAKGDQARCPDRRRLLPGQPGRRGHRPVPEAGRGRQARAGGDQGLLRRRGEHLSPHRAPAVAERGDAR